MDFGRDPEVEALEVEVRAFLAEHLTPELEARVHRTGVSHDPEFARALGARGWIAADLPRPDRTEVADPAVADPAVADPAVADPVLADPFRLQVLKDEVARTEAPVYATETTTMVLRVIRAVGSEALQAEIVPGGLAGELTIALGMSEPEAGSDVAAVQTRARWVDDHWVIDGQKMFTTNGHVTDYVFLLARTDPDSTRHRGLTTFLVPLDHPGVEAQAVFTLSGERTNITYFAGVQLDDRWRIGEVGRGWDALMLSLQEEHSVGFSPHLDRLLAHAEAWAADRGDPAVHDRLIRWATRLEVAQLLEARSRWMDSVDAVPVYEGPMAKLFSTESLVAAAEDITELVGPDGLRSRGDATALAGGHIEHALRFSLGTTIYAGTSEIQRNIIAQRGCGLPR